MWKLIFSFTASLMLFSVVFVFADVGPPWNDDTWGDDGGDDAWGDSDQTDDALGDSDQEDDSSADHPSLAECEDICKKAELCHSPCAQTNCLTFCTKSLNKSQAVCESMDTCEHINSCLCNQDPSTNGNGGGDDDNGGCSIAKGPGDIWLPLAMLSIGIGALIFSLRSRRTRKN